MDCQNPIIHVIRRGDTLYNLAKHYNTTVQTLLADNEHLNIYNLRIGDEILVCPGETGTYGCADLVQQNNYISGWVPRTRAPMLSLRLPSDGSAPMMPAPTKAQAPMSAMPHLALPPEPMLAVEAAAPPAKPMQPRLNTERISPEAFELYKQMRELWTQHVVWTRAVIISILDTLGDNEAATTRLLRNPDDIARAFVSYYGNAAAKQIEKLFTSHLTIADQLVRALKRGDTGALDGYSAQWQKNAEDIANYFAKLNPNFKRGELLKMFEDHLDLTKREAGFRSTKQYSEDVATFDDIEKQAMHMADYFANGLIKQFPSQLI